MPRRWAGFLVVMGLLLGPVTPASARRLKGALRGVRKYVIINLLLAAADYESARAVQHPGGCRESNALFSPYPGRARFYGEGLAIDAGPELLGWLLHRKHVRMWQAPFAMVSAWHGEGIVTNLRCSAGSP